MQHERDDALRELKIAGDAQARVQALMAENSGPSAESSQLRKIPSAKSAPIGHEKCRNCRT